MNNPFPALIYMDKDDNLRIKENDKTQNKEEFYLNNTDGSNEFIAVVHNLTDLLMHVNNWK